MEADCLDKGPDEMCRAKQAEEYMSSAGERTGFREAGLEEMAFEWISRRGGVLRYGRKLQLTGLFIQITFLKERLCSMIGD